MRERTVLKRNPDDSGSGASGLKGRCGESFRAGPIRQLRADSTDYCHWNHYPQETPNVDEGAILFQEVRLGQGNTADLLVRSDPGWESIKSTY
jgi:hypothetical protein